MTPSTDSIVVQLFANGRR